MERNCCTDVKDKQNFEKKMIKKLLVREQQQFRFNNILEKSNYLKNDEDPDFNIWKYQ